jgi:hypothetical protein
MRAHLRIAAATAALALAGCDTTLPWTSGSTPGGSGGPSIAVSPSSLAFTATQLGGAPPAQVLTVTTHGGPLYVSVSSSGAAVQVAVPNPSAGTVTVAAPAPGAAGTLTGSVTVRAFLDAGGTQEITGSPKVVPVTYTIAPTTAPTISVAAGTPLSFTAAVGRPAPAPKSFEVTLLNGPFTVQATAVGSAIALVTVTPNGPTSATVTVTPAAPDTYTGTRSGSVSVSGCLDAGCTQLAAGSPRTVAVTYTTTASGFQVSPSSLSLGTVVAGVPADGTLSLADTNGTAAWTAQRSSSSSGATWLTVNTPSGTDLPATVDLTVDFPATASPGPYSAYVDVTSLGVKRSIYVSANVVRPRIVAAPSPVALDAVQNQSPLPSGTLDLTTQHGGTLAYTAAVTYGAGASGWLSVESGSAPGALPLTVTTAGLAPGTYTATLTLTPANGAAATPIPLSYTVTAPALAASPASLSFGVSASTVVADTIRSLDLSAGGPAVAWTASPSQPWLQVSSASGTTPATVSVSLDVAALETVAAGAQAATVDFTYDLGSGTTATRKVPVDLLLDLPHVTTVAPRISVAGVGGDVILRGGGFATPFTGALRFGTADATAVTTASATEVRATPPTTLAAGSHLVTVPNALGLTRSTARLEVVATAVRTLTSVASAGHKGAVVFDDARKVLFVANTGDETTHVGGKVERFREAASWAKAADGSDERSITYLGGLTPTTDGAALLVSAGTQYGFLDAATLGWVGTAPQATAYSGIRLAMLNSGKAVFANTWSGWGDVGTYDPATKATFQMPYPNDRIYLPDVSPASADGSRALAYGNGTEQLMLWSASSSTSTRVGPSATHFYVALDRHATRALVDYSIYDSSWTKLAGKLPSPIYDAVLSPLGNGRAYVWDGAAVACYDTAGTPDPTTSVYPLEFSVPVATADRPGPHPVMTVSADERTAFIAGDDRVVVVPLPQ